MPHFQYNALDHTRRAAEGVLDAPTRGDAIRTLSEGGLFVTDLREANDSSRPASPASAGRAVASAPIGSNGSAPSAVEAEPGTRAVGSSLSSLLPGGRRIGMRRRVAMLRQIATALEAGLPLLSSLRIVRDQADSPGMDALLGDLAERVEGGESLSEAMAEHPANFSPLHVSMVRAGETAGVLDEVMASLTDFAERDMDLREKIRSAATYPAMVLALAGVSVIVILTFILPRILSAVSETAAVLPLPTRVLLATSGLLRSWGWLGLIVLALGAWAFAAWRRRPEGRLAIDRFKLAVPVLGPTLRKAAIARFARTLGTLSKSGIQILEALRVLRDTLGNEALARQIDRTREEVAGGRSIAEPLKRTGLFPPMFIQVVAMGERTGKLDDLLLRAADAYDRETAAAVQRTMTILPAVFIVLIALVVAFILAAVLLPIVNMQMAVG